MECKTCGHTFGKNEMRFSFTPGRYVNYAHQLDNEKRIGPMCIKCKGETEDFISLLGNEQAKLRKAISILKAEF